VRALGGVAVVASLAVAVGIGASRAAAAPGATTSAPQVAASAGYWEVGSDGGVFAFGGVGFFGSMGGTRLAEPVVGVAPTTTGDGYWEVASDGGVFSFGGARFLGSLGGVRLARPIVAMAADPAGTGYWLVGADGGVFAYGGAGFYGSTGGLHLVSPVVAMAATPDGRGYWLVAADGGVFAFGDAPYLGSVPGTGAHRRDVVSVLAPDGAGYSETSADGTSWSFGDAATEPSLSSLGARVGDIVGSASAGRGLWEVGADGGVFALGGAPYAGSLPALGVHHVHVVGIAAPGAPAPPIAAAGGTAPPGGAPGSSGWSAPQPFDPAAVGASQVSCASAGFCAAVDGTDALFTWDGAWSSPTTLTGHVFQAVSCPSATFCVATGSTGSGASAQTDAVTYDGTSWVPAPSFAPVSTVGGLVGVSCPSAAFCAAVGDQATSSSTFGTLVEAYDGRAWSVVPTEDPDADATGGYSLRAVSCASASSCQAVGAYTSRQSGDTASFVESWNGSAWSVSVPPGLQDGFRLASLSCPTATWCTAVGSASYPHSPQPSTALVETYDGGAWTLDPTPPAAPLWPVACTGPSSCVAGGPGGIVVVDAGGTWKSPAVVDGANIVTSLSCSADGFCMATDNAGNALTSRP